MIRLRILDILAEQNHTKYWLFKRMDMSYQNFNKIVNNENTARTFSILAVFLSLRIYIFLVSPLCCMN